ncbi:MAG TPA: RcnB family protein [Caulobacterales bacterium]|nr:RcnB family protein [Caulobacterales bacterium]
MKRLAIAAAAALTLVSPLTAAAAYADPPRYQNNRDHDRRDDNRWDQSRHNGYTYNGRWHYGPPPASYAGRPGFQPGYQAWRRGERLPSYYRTHYVVVNDYRAHHLRPPPRGYHYVRDDRGEYLLVGIATGIIASIILNQ